MPTTPPVADMKRLARMYAKLFIARQDCKAIQHQGPSGAIMYSPVRRDSRDPNSLLPWSMQDLIQHISGESTFGHYLLNAESESKIIAFDVDLTSKPFDLIGGKVPRDEWHDRRSEHRTTMKTVLKSTAHMIVEAIKELDIPWAVAYSGNKGLHVYGFTGKLPASDIRTAGNIIMENELVANHFQRSGNSGFLFDSTKDEYAMVTIEMFPKQDKIDGSGFGNLMRLPLGIHRKSPKEPTMFLDMDLSRTPIGQFTPIDPFVALDNEFTKGM